MLLAGDMTQYIGQAVAGIFGFGKGISVIDVAGDVQFIYNHLAGGLES